MLTGLRSLFLLIGDVTTDHHIEFFLFTEETWLQQEDFVRIKEFSPVNYLNVHISKTTG